jgi:hypothetical protein
MATMATSPIQGTGCDISASLLGGNPPGDAIAARHTAGGQVRGADTRPAHEPPGQAKDEVDLGQDEDDRQKDHGEARQDQEQLAEQRLQWIHLGAPLSSSRTLVGVGRGCWPPAPG